MKNNPVIITGIHRSGTSLLSKIFQNENVYFGSVKDINNESIFFQNINKWIMSSNSSTWDNPLTIRDNLKDERYSMLLNKIHNMLNSWMNFKYFGWSSLIIRKSFFTFKSKWGWKDPRNIFTLPFWLNIFPDSKVVILIRHPYDVVNSLISRNALLLKNDIKNKNRFYSYFLTPLLNINNYSNLSSNLDTFEDGMKLYDIYYNEIQFMKEKYPDKIIIVKYEDIIIKKHTEIQNIFDFCNLELGEKNKLFMETIYSDRMYNFKSQNIRDYEKFNDKLIEYGYSNEN